MYYFQRQMSEISFCNDFSKLNFVERGSIQNYKRKVEIPKFSLIQKRVSELSRNVFKIQQCPGKVGETRFE